MPNKNKPEKVKQEHFTVKLECLIPTTMTYKILAESPEQAIEKAEKNIIANISQPPKQHFGKSKRLNATVYKAGYSNILSQKKY